eukprot:122563-Rhodomonas_salina.2
MAVGVEGARIATIWKELIRFCVVLAAVERWIGGESWISDQTLGHAENGLCLCGVDWVWDVFLGCA